MTGILEERIRIPFTQDRCDGPGVRGGLYPKSCGAETFVRVRVPDFGSLDFCGHHFRHYEIQFLINGYEVTKDERKRIPK